MNEQHSAGTTDPKVYCQCRALSCVGTGGKHWMIVNGLGGLLRYFDGTKRQAEAEARRETKLLERCHVK